MGAAAGWVWGTLGGLAVGRDGGGLRQGGVMGTTRGRLPKRGGSRSMYVCVCALRVVPGKRGEGERGEELEEAVCLKTCLAEEAGAAP